MSNSWLTQRIKNPQARLRLFCYPHAGGGASSFNPWRAHLPSTVELCPLEPPGRWTRHAEPPLRRIDELVESFISELRGLLDLPYVLFGHSVGGFAMFEAAHRLATLGASPRHLIVAAREAPQFPLVHRMQHLPEDELIATLGEVYGAARMSAMADPEIRALFLPALRADLEALETYDGANKGPIAAPLSAFYGRSDPTFDESRVQGWNAHTTAPFEAMVLEGDHFFVHAAESGFLNHLRAILDSP